MTYQTSSTPIQLAVDQDQAAERLGIQAPTLEKDRRSGHLGIPYVRVGRRIIYPLIDLNRWLEKNRITPRRDEVGGTK